MFQTRLSKENLMSMIQIGQWMPKMAILGATVMMALSTTGCSREDTVANAKGNAHAAVAIPPTDHAKSQDTGTPVGSAGDFDAILKKYVDGDYFDYAGLKASPDDSRRFDSFLSWQAKADVSKMSRDDQIAFYINAYNACCIKAILDHYPVKTPKDIPGFFDQLKFVVAGESLTINEIEYDRLIARYQDMRAHFAVVCSDRSCLPLKPGAYTGKALDLELEGAATKFVNSRQHFRVDHEKKVVYVSKIFDWYGQKFLKDEKRPVAGSRPELYLLQWLDDETRKLLESGEYRLEFIEWDWTLNERPKTKESR